MSEYKDYGFHNNENSHTHNYLLKPILNLISTKNTPVLDLGCGNGSFANELIKNDFDVYGTDASEQGIKLANQINPDRFFIQDLSSDQLPVQLQRIPFKTIVSTEVIEHLYAPRTFVSFAKKILLKNGGGEFIVSTPYHGYLKNLTIALTNKMDSHINPLWDGGHIKIWSRKTLTALLKEQGFQVTHFKGCGRFPYLWKSMVIRATIA
ncbi:class I SAM-dependent methyltransferase [Pedobacter sp.]|uniref:class I SAM-dependent methyltransferase n=1 Tax=Pedobacter sp. TaxID=1411316 RepID=UPI00396C4A64